MKRSDSNYLLRKEKIFQELLKACKQCTDPMGLPVSLTPEETLIQIRRLLRQAIVKAEGI